MNLSRLFSPPSNVAPPPLSQTPGSPHRHPRDGPVSPGVPVNTRPSSVPVTVLPTCRIRCPEPMSRDMSRDRVTFLRVGPPRLTPSRPDYLPPSLHRPGETRGPDPPRDGTTSQTTWVRGRPAPGPGRTRPWTVRYASRVVGRTSSARPRAGRSRGPDRDLRSFSEDTEEPVRTSGTPPCPRTSVTEEGSDRGRESEGTETGVGRDGERGTE